MFSKHNVLKTNDSKNISLIFLYRERYEKFVFKYCSFFLGVRKEKVYLPCWNFHRKTIFYQIHRTETLKMCICPSLSGRELSGNFQVFTPTESSSGGTLLYIANHLSYKPHQNLNIQIEWIGVYFHWNSEHQKIKHCWWHI